MRATVMHGAGDVRIETVPDAHLVERTDALVTVTRAAICGSDLKVDPGFGYSATALFSDRAPAGSERSVPS